MSRRVRESGNEKTHRLLFVVVVITLPIYHLDFTGVLDIFHLL